MLLSCGMARPVSSVINVRVACNGFTSAHNIEVALSFTYKFLAAFDVDAV